jgi:hypothetical protein
MYKPTFMRDMTISSSGFITAMRAVLWLYDGKKATE